MKRVAGLFRVSICVGSMLVVAGCSEDFSFTPEPESVGTSARVRLLTREQYINSLSFIFGDDIVGDIRFPPLRRQDGLLALSAASVGITASSVEELQRGAVTIAQRIVDREHRDYLLSCKPVQENAPDDECANQFLSSTGHLLFRRPLTQAESERLTKVARDEAERFDDFYVGVAYALTAMLQSPKFLYVIDETEPDPERPGKLRLTSASLATRLSLLLWNATPDDEVLQVAETDDLHDRATKARLVDKMIASERLTVGVRAFFDDMLGLADFANLSKDGATYPRFGGKVAEDAKEQILRTIVDHVVVKKADYRDLFTSRETFVSPSLAAFYNVPGPDKRWDRLEFPEGSSRAGLLTQVGYLSLYAMPARSSPTKRGKAIREGFLCQTVPSPPANVDFSGFEDPKSEAQTARERLAVHSTNPTCAGCHKIMDPIGLALENFDGAGQFRVAEKGMKIDSSGDLDGVSYTDAVGLGRALHDHPAVTSCLVSRVFNYASGGPGSKKDREINRYFEARFKKSGYKMTALLRTIALSRTFSSVSTTASTK